MIMLISLEGNLTQTRTGLCRVTFPCKGPMRGHYLLLMAKSQSYYMFIFSIIISGDFMCYFIENDFAY